MNHAVELGKKLSRTKYDNLIIKYIMSSFLEF